MPSRFDSGCAFWKADPFYKSIIDWFDDILFTADAADLLVWWELCAVSTFVHWTALTPL
jgi:hypothetical protein